MSLLGATALLVLARSVPIELDREDARQLAERELADPVYEDEPTLTERVITWSSTGSTSCSTARPA